MLFSLWVQAITNSETRGSATTCRRDTSPAPSPCWRCCMVEARQHALEGRTNTCSPRRLGPAASPPCAALRSSRQDPPTPARAPPGRANHRLPRHRQPGAGSVAMLGRAADGAHCAPQPRTVCGSSPVVVVDPNRRAPTCAPGRAGSLSRKSAVVHRNSLTLGCARTVRARGSELLPNSHPGDCGCVCAPLLNRRSPVFR